MPFFTPSPRVGSALLTAALSLLPLRPAAAAPANESNTTCDALDRVRLQEELSLQLSLFGLELEDPAASGARPTGMSQTAQEESEPAGDSSPEYVQFSARTKSARTKSARTPDTSEQLRLRMRCAPSGEIQLSVAITPSAPPVQMERVITARDIPEQALAATLAIALSELARSALNAHQARLLEDRAKALEQKQRKLDQQKAELDLARSEQEPTTPPGEALIPPVGRKGDVQAALGVIAAESAPYRPMFGFELGLSYQQLSSFRWSVEGSFVLSREGTQLGTLDVLRSGLSLGGDFHLSSVPALQVGPRAQVHLLSAEGQSHLEFDEQRQWGYALSASLRATLEVAASRALVLRSSFEVGPVLRSMTFTAAGQTAYAFQGAWFAWGLAGAWRTPHHHRHHP